MSSRQQQQQQQQFKMTAFIDRPIPSMLANPAYEVDSLHPQVYPQGYMSPTGRQSFLVPGPGSVSMVNGAQYAQSINGQFILPSQGVMHALHSPAGDLHSPFGEEFMPGYPQHRRFRRTTVGGIPAGHYAYTGAQLGQMGQQMGIQMGLHPMEHLIAQQSGQPVELLCGGIEICAWCRASHPMPHPLMQNHQHLPPMMSMNMPRNMQMDEPRMARDQRFKDRLQHLEGIGSAMFDPMDGGSQPWNANFQRREFEYGGGSSKRSRSSGGPRRIMGTPFDDPRITEASDSEEEDEMIMRGRGRRGPGSGGPGLQRRNSNVRMRSASRGSRAPSNAPFV